MKSLLLVVPASLLAAGAVMAQQQPASDSVVKDGDPVTVGSAQNPTQGPDTPAEAPAPAPMSTTQPSAPSATAVAPPATDATATTTTRLYTTTTSPTGAQVIANAPIPDTPENRARYGQPLSRAGKQTAPAGN